MTVRRPIRKLAFAGSLLSLTVVGLQLPPEPAEAARYRAPAVQKESSVRGDDYVAPRLQVEDEAAANERAPRAARWPAAAQGRVGVAKGARARLGQSPVWVTGRDGSPREVAVEVLGREATERAGVRGLLVKVAASDAAAGPLGVSVGYAGLEGAYGGDWVSRLRLVEMPACFATTPEVKDCQQGRPLRTRLDHRTKTATADVSTTSSGATLALAAGPSGSSGSYAATPLSPSASWNVNLQTGDFSWTYPLRVPPAINGPQPALQVGYSSSSVDGRTAGTNNQVSWLGEGQTLEWGFIERSYQGCSEDMKDGNNSTKTGDLCWHSNNAHVAFGGHSGELVRDPGTNQWRLKNDDGSKFEKLTGAANGDNDGEHWRLTTTDGTQYYFGLTKRYAADTVNTQSTLTTPVFGNHAGEPCYTASYATAFCKQAWRWNLDYVVDPSGNSMTYFYTTETNNYGRNMNKAVSTYERAAYPIRIEYGERQGSEATTNAPARVLFTTAERCIPTGTFDCAVTKLTEANAHHWPDVPFDQICTSTTACADRFSPTFFTRKRLTGVTTQVWNGTAYAAVDSWTFTQSFPQAGDGTSASLWLKSIGHTGNVGTATTLPAIGFVGTQLENRVDGIDNAPPMTKYRVSSVTSESGGLLSVQYTNQDCSPTDLPASKPHNTRRCYPVYFTPDGALDPEIHWFHKYLVSSVIEADRMGGAEDLISTYQYLGGAAWHYDNSEMTKPKHKTWSEFRGYEKVAIIKGNTLTKRTYEEHTFLRGMDGDRLADGTTRDVVVTDSRGGTVRDQDRLNGFALETRVLDGVGGPEVTSTINRPWVSDPTAVEGDDKAQLMQVASTRVRTALSGGGERTTGTNTTYDVRGMPIEQEDLGSTSTTSDDLCTTTTYNRSVTKWILTPVKRIEKVSAPCGAAVSRPADVVSDTRMYYDGATDLATEPTKGRLTKTEALQDWNGGPVYRQRHRSVYDIHGREIENYDALNRLRKTTFTPATGAIPTQVVTTNPAGHTHTATLNREWGMTTAEVDANGARTDLTYDGLGRLSQVWLPGRSKAGGATANLKFTYSITSSAAPYVKSEELRNDGTYTATYEIFDSLLRSRQTQTPASGTQGGRLIQETRYDSRGFAIDDLGPYFNSSAAGPTLFSVTDVQIPALTRTTYDGVGRPTLAVFMSEGVEKWRTTTSYGGDRVSINPPDGDVPTTTLTDARGNVTESRRYHGDSPSGTYDSVDYTHTPDGKLKSFTDPGGSVWSYEFDVAGRTVKSHDPDAGTTTSTYDLADQLITSTDAEGRTTWNKYDVLGRKVETRDGGSAGRLRSSWTYDTLTNGKGRVTSSTRYEGGTPTVPGAAYTTAVSSYDVAGRPLGSRVTIPSTEGTLAGTYATNLTYNVDGGVKTKSLPAAPGLAAETLRYFYNTQGESEWFSGIGSYVTGTTYSPYGEPLQLAMGQTVGKFAWQTFEYETGTRRMLSSQVDRETAATSAADVFYSYDLAGNVTSIVDKPGGQVQDAQCFDYDHAKRITDAWTSSNGTCGTPSVSVMGTSSASYWHSYTYDADGNRKTEVAHALTGDTTRTYEYTSPKPHALTRTVQQNTAGSIQEDFRFDDAGNLEGRRTGSEAEETFTWDADGLKGFTDKEGATSSYVYDANGERLLRKEPTGSTLYLDGTEIFLPAGSTTATSTRYYTHAGQTVALRTAAGVQFLADDHQGTATVQISATDLSFTKRRSLPFGGPRGDELPWVGQRGFVGGTKDEASGLTHLGAREYDPATGRFISPDPLIDTSDPGQMNGYAYSNHSPVTFSDPSGLMLLADGGGGGYSSRNSGTSQGGGNEYVPPYVPPVVLAAEETVNAAASDYDEAKQKMIEVATELAEIVADELGISAGIDCITSGENCGEAVVSLLTSFGIGIAGKIAAKYGAPWKWDDGLKLGKRIGGLVDDGIDAADNWNDARKVLDNAEDALDTARDSAKATTKAIDKAEDAACNSFLPGTPVLMADGSSKAIEDVAVGDRVMTGRGAGAPVANDVGGTIVGFGVKELVRIEVDVDGDAGEETGEVTATDGHPFWLPARDQWVDAGDLQVGDLFRTAEGGVVSVVSVVAWTEVAQVHNLSVRDIHTYFVGVGDTWVLVHNAKCSTFGRWANKGEVPDVSGVYIIRFSDGKVYIGSASGTGTIHKRVHRAFTDKRHAVQKGEGYSTAQIHSMTFMPMPGASKLAIRQREQALINAHDGPKGGILLNRINAIKQP